MPLYSTKFNKSQGPGTHRHDSRKGFLPWNEILSKTHFLDREWNL
jgi:hypothetical protein